MADLDFEELNKQHTTPTFQKTALDAYTLVHDVYGEISPEEIRSAENTKPPEKSELKKKCFDGPQCLWNPTDRTGTDCLSSNKWRGDNKQLEIDRLPPTTIDRKRRKLPEIPKTKKCVKQLSLADEIGAALSNVSFGTPNFVIGGATRPLPVLMSLRGEDSSPDSDRFHSTDVDSGNSTAHSPDLVKSVSPQLYQGSFSPVSPSSTSQLELVDPTHRGLHRFIPRHSDEIEIEIGDPIYVNNEAEDLWCEGINLRTGQQGIFPSAHVVDVDYSDFDPSQQKVRRERFLLGYLGSVETLSHKGNSVLCQAVKKIRSKDYTPHSCVLEISDTGIRMVDRKKPALKQVQCHDYFYSLKNVSFCAFHPRDQRYLGFITKHPTLDRFACHVFIATESTRPVAEAVGRAFQRFYQKFVETAYPVEDIYIE